ncbi:hypothetical protein FHS76_003677 [Ochrobactrum daejeonense]|uniref:Uncharacterized protein n=1 Tax=Brucella daejeonensis TaxID=659015 RepID=A0A7W9EMU1_9HYPH|nr:hypothetical protein [Brucella daejeonensis]MBB5703767.1 hypothetical protein [Brucella daejeonensis]
MIAIVCLISMPYLKVDFAPGAPAMLHLEADPVGILHLWQIWTLQGISPSAAENLTFLP